jgi:carboxymethylenebutenolidase
MPVSSEWIQYGDQRGFFAWPQRAAQPLPAVIVIQEIWGVEAQIEDVTRRIAASGYAALAPDLFAQAGSRPPALSVERIGMAQQFSLTAPPGAMFDPTVREAALASLPADQGEAIRETIGAIMAQLPKQPAMVAQLRQALGHLRRERTQTKGQPVGCVGFCMGGGLSALLACEEPELEAAAIYYGNSPAPEQAAKIRCPIIAFHAETDQRILAGLPAFEATLKAKGVKYEAHVYHGAHHGFFNEIGRVYSVDAARDSWRRLLGFFQAELADKG